MRPPLTNSIFSLLVAAALSGCTASDMLQPVDNPIPGVSDSRGPSPQNPSFLDGAYELSALTVVPTAIFTVTPNYPAVWRRSGIQGQAVIVFVVKPDGGVTDVSIAKATDVLFGQSAVLAVRQ